MKPRPLIIASCICPLCCKVKEVGLMVCWPCFEKHDLKNSNAHIEERLDEIERDLSGVKAA